MPKLKPLSGKEFISVLETFGFEQAAQRGSHVKLRRLLADGTKKHSRFRIMLS